MSKKAKLYNWDTIEGEEVRPGVSRKGFRGDQFMMVMNTLEPGMEVNPHSHPFEQAVYIVQGKVRFHVGDEPVLNLDIFAPLRDDYMHLVEYQKFEENES